MIMRSMVDEILLKTERTLKAIDETFDKEFLDKFKMFMLLSENISDISKKENSEQLFKKCDLSNGIKPIFEYRKSESLAEKERYDQSTYGVYHFNYPDGIDSPIRIDITRSIKAIPDAFKGITKNGSKPRCCVDIEFFERPRLEDDSKNKELEEFIKEYCVNGKWKRGELEELGNLMALQDLEKIHLKYLVFENDQYLSTFIGIGTNQPYGLAEKQGYSGKARYYKYCLETRVEQTCCVTTGHEIRFDSDSLILPEYVAKGVKFALYPKEGVIIEDHRKWKKAKLERKQSALVLSDEVDKNINLNNLKQRIDNLFPDFDKYQFVFYDPIERTKSIGHIKVIKHLFQRGLLGRGWQSIQNVASDLYMNAHCNVYRIKPISIMLSHFIAVGELEKMIIDTSKSIESKPIKMA